MCKRVTIMRFEAMGLINREKQARVVERKEKGLTQFVVVKKSKLDTNYTTTPCAPGFPEIKSGPRVPL